MEIIYESNCFYGDSGVRVELDDMNLWSQILTLLEPFYKNKKPYDFLDILRDRVCHLRQLDAERVEELTDEDFDRELFAEDLHELDELIKALKREGWHYIVGACQRELAHKWGGFDYHPVSKNQLSFAQWTK